jgi:transposase
MDQGSAMATTDRTIGLDLGDRWTHLCVVDREGRIVEESRVATAPEALRQRLAGYPPSRVVLEVGTHSPWVSRVVEELGHEGVVANPRKLRLIYANDSKSDRVDAEALARVGRLDPELLHPIRHRGAERQADRVLLRSREALVRTRTALVNHVRGAVKAMGQRLPACTTVAFARRALPAVPTELRDALEPVLGLIQELTVRIRAYDRAIRQRGEAHYPETQLLRQVTGVGPLTALAFVLCIEDPRRFPRSRTVGAYLGLRPRQSQSGERNPQLRITKAGDEGLRRYLIGSAHYILGPFGPDCDLRRFGLRLAERGGGPAAKKRAIVAVARKLAVLLHRLWVTGEGYEPLRHAAPTPSAA